ncbi:orotidine-5'-phosphate decarboxylase [Aureimonas pseudogalii]|uniref:Orotidine 5'-phosphate decarboxylase n=1 Tax=Aureimonas pseudogalii TaxID=1744844 RepID=A0A7W6EBD4_9HYPH|nr:orotidine-5'-phosphate decarboxylase [Aureimonas pseudogalii]MBB3997734.1 orotidine-5'-phosphate decarboxylase [Aureimonas pseudogalii]
MILPSQTLLQPADRLIVGLDVSDRRSAESIVAELGDTVRVYKVGYQLGYAGGLDFVGELVRAGKRVFLDLKLHDIGNIVEKGIAGIAGLGVAMTTVHATPQVMRAAARGAEGSGLLVLAVTVLTSLSEDDLREMGHTETAAALVERRTRQAMEAGIGGIVASAAEAAAVRAIVGPDRAVVTPGIRPAGSAAGDQTRVMTPREAIAAGASHLVVGRPILDAPDRLAAARAILAEMA